MKKKLCLLAFLIFYSLGFSQEKSVVDSYVDYFTLPRETLFLHTNKTTYIPGEEIWFKVYAYDRKSQLTSKVTTNIQLSIFDADGNQVDQKLFRAQEGFAHGNIAVDSTFVTGNYFIKVGTNWMKNFQEDDAFVKKISIINQKYDAKQTTVNTQEFDVQFLPEGGHLLAGVKNIVGVKVIDDKGKGTKASGSIVDQDGNEIASFNTNFLGIGRFSFVPVDGQSYTAKITLDNTNEIELPLPESKSKGISIAVNNTRPSDVIIDFNTNDASFPQVKAQAYKMLIHKDGITKVIPVQFTTNQKRFVIAKEALFKGVNTITLFDENQNPLVERMFFNETPIKNYQVSLRNTSVVNDSLVVSLETNLENNITANTSISVLPKGTKSYAPKHNMLSAFYLKPYLKGSIENPSYYFTNINRKKRYELDLLLLTQGWSRYSWDNIFRNPPTIRYKFENGITINGNVNSDIVSLPKLMLQPTLNNPTRFIEYDQKGRFQIENYFPMKNEELRFSLINKKGKGKPPKMAVNSLLLWEKESINLEDFQEYRSFYADKNSIPTNFINDREVLDEVVVSGRLSPVFNKKGPPFKGSIIKVTDSVALRFANLAKILDTEKFIVFQGAEISVRSVERNSRGGTRPVFYFVDGQPVNPIALNMLFTSPTSEFEDIYIDYSNNVVQNPVTGIPVTESIIINLFSRRTNFKTESLNRNASSTSRTLKHGFEPVKEFYTPRYINYEIESFKEYGVIHWEPNALFQPNQATQLTVVETGLNEIDFYIEGITSDGNLISTIVSFDNKKP
jgi:hypothetical protein